MTHSSARLASGIANLLLLALAVACASQPPASTGARAAEPPAPGLTGTSWRLEDLGGVPALAGVEATLEFPGTGRVAGRASCNRFTGTIEISGQSIKFGPLAATKMACVGPADEQERRYFDALSKAERFALDGPALKIYSAGMDQPLRFARK